MKLNLQLLDGLEAGVAVELPSFDVMRIRTQTKQQPGWLHFGPGNIFRAFVAVLQQRLLEEGKSSFGIVAVAPNNPEIIREVYHPHDNLSLLVTMMPDQSRHQKVVASIAESLAAVPGTSDWQRLQEISRCQSLQIMSFTITEKGYKTRDAQGQWLPSIALDLQQGWKAPQTFPVKVVSLLYERFLHGAAPLTLLSLDNCAQNGQILRQMISGIAEVWVQRGLVPREFLSYTADAISYPSSMIDKITPRPSETVRDMLLAEGFEDMDFVKSSRGGCYAPFVNAEKTEYLVVEDHFVNGRPPLEAAGVIFTDAETVEKAERMKVCTCLNPLHTALAVFGCLFGYTTIAAEMNDSLLKRLVEKIGYEEGLKVVTDPGVLNPKAFMDECIQVRFPNPAIPDTPQRIACDTSQKMPIRFGETIKAYAESETLSVEKLCGIPLVIAGWCRYLMGVDDQGVPFPISEDPLLPDLQSAMHGITLGQPAADLHQQLQPILTNTNLWKMDLYAIGLGQKVEMMFTELIAGKHAVRQTLKKYLEENS